MLILWTHFPPIPETWPWNADFQIQSVSGTDNLCVYTKGFTGIYRLHFATNTFLQLPCTVETAFRDLFMHTLPGGSDRFKPGFCGVRPLGAAASTPSDFRSSRNSWYLPCKNGNQTSQKSHSLWGISVKNFANKLRQRIQQESLHGVVCRRVMNLSNLRQCVPHKSNVCYRATVLRSNMVKWLKWQGKPFLSVSSVTSHTISDYLIYHENLH